MSQRCTNNALTSNWRGRKGGRDRGRRKGYRVSGKKGERGRKGEVRKAGWDSGREEGMGDSGNKRRKGEGEVGEPGETKQINTYLAKR